MDKYKNVIINEETGEIVYEESISIESNKKYTKIHKKLVDEMLEKASKGEKLDSDMLYQWCKITGDINSYGQIKINGEYINSDFKKKMLMDIIMTGYTMRVIDLAHPFSGFLQKNKKTYIESWMELYDAIGIGNSNATRAKVKKFLLSHNIVRDFRIGGVDGQMVRRLILNPFIARNGAYTSQISAMVYQDFIRDGININCYPLRWLQSMGYIKTV
ncbi:MAG: hypothetical protein ACRC7S_09855 [Cetobacterium sp.]